MPLNVAKLVNDILDSAVLYIYAHLSAIWIVARHPIRGPRYLAYKNLRNIDHTVSPRAFLFVNLFICFYFVEFASPLIFVFWQQGLAAFAEAFKQIRASQVDFVPIVVRSLVVFTTIYAVLDVATALFERHPRKRRLIRNSLLFSFGLQPLAVIVAFLYVTRFDLFSTKQATLILTSTLLLLALITSLAIAYALSAFRPRALASRDALIRHARTAVVATLFVTIIYVEGIALALWDPFPRETKLAVSQVSCGWMPSGDVVVEAFLDNPTSSRKLIPLQTDVTSRDIIVWQDSILIEGGVLESSAGSGAPYLVLPPGGSGWVRFKGTVPSSGVKPKDCNMTLQKDQVSGGARWHSN